MEKDPVLEKYKSEGFGTNAMGWYFNPWIDEYDENYDPHNDKEYNEELNKKEKNKKEIKWHPKLTKVQIEELIENGIEPGDNEYNLYLWNYGIDPFENQEEKPDSQIINPIEPEEEKTETTIVEPIKPETTKIEPIKKESKDIVFTEIAVSTKNNELFYTIKIDNGESKAIRAINYTKDFINSKEIKDIIKESQERLGNAYKLKAIKRELDPNILDLLKDNPDVLDKYVQAIYSNNEPEQLHLPFKLDYDLKGIRQSELSRKEKSNLRKVVKGVRNLEEATVQKDPNIIEKIKEMLRRANTKRLEAGTIFNAILTGEDSNITKNKIQLIRETQNKEIKNKPNKIKNNTILKLKQRLKGISNKITTAPVVEDKNLYENEENDKNNIPDELNNSGDTQGKFNIENVTSDLDEMKNNGHFNNVKKIVINHEKAASNVQEQKSKNANSNEQIEKEIFDD